MSNSLLNTIKDIAYPKRDRAVWLDSASARLSNCCDVNLVPETDVCSSCLEHCGFYVDREAEEGEMLCPECYRSIMPRFDSGDFDADGMSGTVTGNMGDLHECPECEADVSGPEFDKWVDSHNDN